MKFDPLTPYNDLPLLPPQAELETRSVLRACIGARSALAELKQAGHLVPNQGILINTIPILEAQASSEIENIVTTTDELFRFAQAEQAPSDPATKEALRYRTALNSGFASLTDRPLTTGTAVNVCRTILGIDAEIRRVPGTALVNQTTGQVVYTPPEGEHHLRDLLSNWEKFLHPDPLSADGSEELDPLVRMAVAHYQFEAVHPFTDGNGRTGRILNLLYLIESGLLELPVLYLSGAIMRSKNDYYQLLRGVTTDGNWEPWILYMLQAVETTARWTTARIVGIRDLMRDMRVEMQEKLPNVHSRELLEVIFEQPYCRIQNVVDAKIAQRQTASAYLKRLANQGFLTEMAAGRERLFVNPRLMRLLLGPATPESGELG